MFRTFWLSNRLPNRYFPKIDVGCPCAMRSIVHRISFDLTATSRAFSRYSGFPLSSQLGRKRARPEACLPCVIVFSNRLYLEQISRQVLRFLANQRIISPFKSCMHEINKKKHGEQEYTNEKSPTKQVYH